MKKSAKKIGQWIIAMSILLFVFQMVGFFVFYAPLMSRFLGGTSDLSRQVQFAGLSSILGAVSYLLIGIGFGSVLIFLEHLVKADDK